MSSQEYPKFLDPEHVQTRLLRISTYMSCFEYVKHTIIERVRSFFDFDYALNPKAGYSKEYSEKVLSRKKGSAFHGSIDWFRENEAISDEDIKTIDKMFEVRNALAHNMHGYVLENKDLPENFDDCWASMITLFDKIEKWWVINIEIPTDPDMTPEKFDSIQWDGIQSGAVMTLQILLDVASGSRELLDMYLKRSR